MAIDVADIATLLLLALLVLGPVAWAIRHYEVLEDLRTAGRVLRLDAPALAVGGLLSLGSIALLRVAYEPAAPLSMLAGATLLALGAGGVTVAAANLDWYRASRRLPVTSPADVEPGPVQLAGRAVPLGEFVPSGVTKTDALAYRAVTREEYAVLGRGYAASTWSPVAVADGAVRFGVVEPAAVGGAGDDVAGGGGDATGDGEDAKRDGGDAGSGGGAAEGGRELPANLRAELDGPDGGSGADATAVAVEAPAAAFPLLSPTSRLLAASPAGSTLDGLERTIPAEPGTAVPVADELDRGTRSRPREYSERRLDPGEPVYVLGTARETEGGGIEIGADPDGPPLIVARLTAETARAHARHVCRTYGLLGLTSMAAGAALIASFGL